MNLKVPILEKGSNYRAGQGQVFVGGGSSYNVSQSLFSLEDQHPDRVDIDQNTLRSKKYVAKRIIPLPSHIAGDRIQLAAITNEVRILANETLKKLPHIVKLICAAWDEEPTWGRHWPRLLIEAADYGNLAEFMAGHDDSRKWEVKVELLLDIGGGLNVLHNHQVAHCDLKLENVLVFRSEEGREPPSRVKYQAKLCDFGFSVIMSDYKPKSTYSAILGTKPWNAPELAFGTPIDIELLPMADVYSLALLFSRVLMHGGNPFEGLDEDDIRRLKQDPTPMVVSKKVISSIFERLNYPELLQLLIERFLLVSLNNKPEERLPLRFLGMQLLFMGLFQL